MRCIYGTPGCTDGSTYSLPSLLDVCVYRRGPFCERQYCRPSSSHVPVIILTYNNTLWLVIKRPKDCTLGIVATYVRGTGRTYATSSYGCLHFFVYCLSLLPLHLDDFLYLFFIFFAVCLLFSVFVFVVVVLFIVLLFSVKHLCSINPFCHFGIGYY